MPNKGIRCFIAISLPERMKQELKKAQVGLKAEKIHASWPAASGFHLTLAFLGEVPADDIPLVKQAMDEAVAGCSGFALETGRLGAFPGPKKPRVIWAGIHGDMEPLYALHQRLHRLLKNAGFVLSGQRFSPHITLARVKRPISSDRLVHMFYPEKQKRPASFRATSITLYKSCLTRSGAIHTRIHAAPFN
ncbi:MAG: RNA 2',3'-cyclic phosphodiesterase [Desulfobacter sp.]